MKKKMSYTWRKKKKNPGNYEKLPKPYIRNS